MSLQHTGGATTDSCNRDMGGQREDTERSDDKGQDSGPYCYGTGEDARFSGWRAQRCSREHSGDDPKPDIGHVFVSR